MPTAEKLPANIEHPAPTPWPAAREQLEQGRSYWLATTRPDGRPHVRPVLAVMLDDALYFVSNAASRKARNLARRSNCVLSVEADNAHLVVEGTAAPVRDEALLQRVADVYLRKYVWSVRVQSGAFDADYGAPTAGPPPYDVYELRPAQVFGFGMTESFSPTRWRF